MRPTFINPDTKDYDITSEYLYLSADPNQGFRSRLPRSILNKILLVESEEVEFLKIATDEIPAGSIVVDAGAGQCRYKEAFPHTKYIGLDMAIGDSDWDYSNLDMVGDLLRMPIKDSCVDAVICIWVLEHIAEPIQFLSEINRILKKNGKLFLAVPQGFGNIRCRMTIFVSVLLGWSMFLIKPDSQFNSFVQWEVFFTLLDLG